MNENFTKAGEANSCLLVRLLLAAAAVESQLEAAVATTGLSLSKFAVLDQLVKAGEPLPLTRLAERLSCVKSNITQLIDRLEADGLVERVDDPKDRRSVLAAMTREGRRRYEIGGQALTAAEKEILKAFKEGELELLGRLLDKFINDG